MAKKPQKLLPLTATEIILRGDAETIRQALEARVQIDSLLEEREAAYRRIAELEDQVTEIVGEESAFPFPEPPMPVAEFVKPATPKKKAEPKAVSNNVDTESENEDEETSQADTEPTDAELDASSEEKN